MESDEVSAREAPAQGHLQDAGEGRAVRTFERPSASMPDFSAQGGETPRQEQKFKEEVFDLFVEFFCREKAFCLKSFIANLERNIILNVLQTTQGNQKEAARLLGTKYTTLNEKIKRYKIAFRITPLLYPF